MRHPKGDSIFAGTGCKKRAGFKDEVFQLGAKGFRDGKECQHEGASLTARLPCILGYVQETI